MKFSALLFFGGFSMNRAGMKQLFCIFGALVTLAILNSCADQSTVNGVTSQGTLPTMTGSDHPQIPSQTNYGHPGGM
ncbi:MAG: hypothetical protein DME57_08440 [Verrucomicrobia bacterium]|nr:MAG: hypothetical protein DME57_08440 [Verrucomicrobiota bacterium]